jgi:16S rRNA (uracil1498-N3)-methyltransferase
MIRLLLPHATEGDVRVVGARLHYVARVLRVKAGDALEVFDGRGSSFDARVTEISETHATLKLSAARSTPAPRAVTLIQGLPKADKMELVLQKGTELGAAGFIAAGSERSIVKLDGKEEKKRERWQRIVEEAARQCGRADVPTVTIAGSLVEAAKQHLGTLLILDEEEHALPLSAAVPETGAVALVIGPEGGLARSEVEALKKLGAVPVTLGPLILRTETAGLAALSVLRHLDGLLG